MGANIDGGEYKRGRMQMGANAIRPYGMMRKIVGANRIRPIAHSPN